MTERRSLTVSAVVLTFLAVGIGRLALTDAYLAYVKPGMRVPLLISSAVMLLLGITNAARADRGEPADGGAEDEADADAGHHDDDDHGHDHHRFPWIGIWLLAPVLCVALVPLRPLGADAVNSRRANVVGVAARQPTGSASTDRSDDETDPARREGGTMKVLDFVDRVINEPEHPFTKPVTLTGFIATEPDGSGFVLGRFVMTCCAADAQPLLIYVRYAGEDLAKDRWVEVTGRQVPPPPGTSGADLSETRNIVIDASRVDVVEQPRQPYETL